MLIIFDLDGTLIDSAKDLAISMNATRAYFEMPLLDPNLIYSFVGNGATVLVRRAMGAEASEEVVKEALAFFLKYYRKHALEHTKLYPGVAGLVNDLKQGGHQLAILTNKPVKISADLVSALGLGKYFMRVYGGDSFARKKPDPIGIRTLLNETQMEPANAWMVGDSGVDVQTARNAGVKSCGVAWGFQPGAFESDRPDVLIEKPAEFLTYLR